MADKPKVNSPGPKARPMPLVKSATRPSDVVPFAAKPGPSPGNAARAKTLDLGKSEARPKLTLAIPASPMVAKQTAAAFPAPAIAADPAATVEAVEPAKTGVVEPIPNVAAIEPPAEAAAAVIEPAARAGVAAKAHPKTAAAEPKPKVPAVQAAAKTKIAAVEPAARSAGVKPVTRAGAAEPAARTPAVRPTPVIAAAEPAAKPAAAETMANAIAANRVVEVPNIEPSPEIAAVEPAAPLASPVTAPLSQEGRTVLTEAFTRLEDNARNFTAQATTGVKSALEKGSKGVAELVEFSKGNLEAVVASGRVAASGVQEMATSATAYGRTSLEKAKSSAQQFAAVKSPMELFQLQSELAKSSFETFAAEASKFGANYMKLLGDIAQPLKSRYELALEKVKTSVAA